MEPFVIPRDYTALKPIDKPQNMRHKDEAISANYVCNLVPSLNLGKINFLQTALLNFL